MRRTDVVGMLPYHLAGRCAASLAPSLAFSIDEWAVGRRYITPVVLTFNEALAGGVTVAFTGPPEQRPRG